MLAEGGEYDDELVEAKLSRMTEADVVRMVNGANSSGLFLRHRDFESYLGGVETDAADPDAAGGGGRRRVSAARATYVRWFGQADAEEIVRLQREGDAGWADNQPVSDLQQPNRYR